MKRMRRMGAWVLAATLCVAAAGCHHSKDSLTPTELSNMGGIDGLTKLMDAWKTNMSANADLSKALTADDMTMVTKGFANEVAKAGGIPMPNSGVDLTAFLQGKHLSQSDVHAMGEALAAATKGNMISPDGAKACEKIWGDVAKHLK